MNIIIVAKVVFATKTATNQKLDVFIKDDSLHLVYELYGPQAETREHSEKVIKLSSLKQGQLYAMVRFWDGWILTEYQCGMTDAVFGINHINQAAILAVTSKGLVVFPNIPTPDAPNVKYIAGDATFWKSLIEIDPDFEKEELIQRSKYVVGASLNSHTSIASLEAQVDLLTRLVLNALPKDTKLYEECSSIDSKHSVLNIKDMPDILDTIISTKSKIRELQKYRKTLIEGTNSPLDFSINSAIGSLIKVENINGNN